MTEQELQEHVKSGQAIPNATPATDLVQYGVYTSGRCPAPAIRCADGFKVSVQASVTHYCQPRDNEGPYTHFELGFPSQEDELIQIYADDPSRPMDTVYPQVPLDSVLALIARHGGRVDVIDI
jgi:hypothetical protein